MERSHLGQFINECRLGRGLTSRQVAQLTKGRPGLTPISHSNLIAIEQGRHIPTFDKIVTLSSVLDVPLQLFEAQLLRDMGLRQPAQSELSQRELADSARRERVAGDYQQALEHYMQLAAEISRQPEPERDMAQLFDARLQLANCRSRLGLARVAKEELEELLGEPGLPPSVEANAYFMLAESYRELGNARLALAHSSNCVSLARELRNQPLEARALNALGNAQDEAGRHRQALETYQQAREILERIDDQRGLGLILRNLGTTWDRLGDLERAIECGRAGVELAQRHQDPHGACVGLTNLGRALMLSGDDRAANEALKQAKDLAQEHGYPDLLFHSLYYLEQIARKQERPSLADVYLDRMRAVRRKLQLQTEETALYDQRNAPRRAKP